MIEMKQKYICDQFKSVALKRQYAIQIKHSSFANGDLLLWLFNIVFDLKLSRQMSYLDFLIIHMGLGGDLDTRTSEKMKEALGSVHVDIIQHRADFHFLK